MKDQLISLETAKLAKEKGFKFSTEDDTWENEYYEPNHMRYHYNRRSEKYSLLSDYYADINQNFQQYGDNEHPHIDAPTQSLLQKWLREKYKILFLFPQEERNGKFYIQLFKDGKRINIELGETIMDYEFDTYEEALERGLYEALLSLSFNEVLKEKYPLQDDTWPSRRWNEDMTDYVDLSGDADMIELE